MCVVSAQGWCHRSGHSWLDIAHTHLEVASESRTEIFATLREDDFVRLHIHVSEANCHVGVCCVVEVSTDQSVRKTYREPLQGNLTYFVRLALPVIINEAM